jgi:3-methyl-2-oxobutanoate hydroxymethyltransferase
MIYHGAAVRRGVKRALLVVDMPFLSYQASEELAVLNCGKVLQSTDADAVKIEGGTDDIVRTVRKLTTVGIPVMAHLGFTPQSVRTLGMRVQGRDESEAQRMVDQARALEDAGAFALVLELIPAELSRRISESLRIPTIGIGAGPHCDGQVLVLPDLLGLNESFAPKFLKKYANLAADARDAVNRYSGEVRSGQYPDAEHSN